MNNSQIYNRILEVRVRFIHNRDVDTTLINLLETLEGHFRNLAEEEGLEEEE